MGAATSCCESCFKSGSSAAREPLLRDDERDAVADLLQFLENRTTTNFFSGNPLSALTTLSYSDNVDLQRSAALAFAEITEKEIRPVGRDTIEPILFLLSSHDTEVQRAASAALGNLAVNAENKLLIVKLNGLEPLIRQMLSPNVEVQCNAVGCVTNLATHDDNKTKIAKSGALVPLTRLARSKDMRVQRNATGALLNMTHSDENRQQLVLAGAIPVLVSLLNSPDTDVQYYCTTALSNIAVDANNRKKLLQSEPKLVQSLVALMDSPGLKVQCQAALALRNLASDEKYQLEIVQRDGLPALRRLIQSTYLPLILSSAACVRNVSIHPQNETPIIEAGFLGPLVNLLAFAETEEIQCHAISTLRNLAASSTKNKGEIVRSGAVAKIKEIVLSCPISVQSEMTACIAVLALSEELKPKLLELGILEVLVPLAGSESFDVQGNSAAAIGNLASKSEGTPNEIDYQAFNDVWTKPQGGLHGYLVNFLRSNDATFQHIAVWTIAQLLDSGDETLTHNIRNSEELLQHLDRLSNVPAHGASGRSTPHSEGTARSRSQSRAASTYNDYNNNMVDEAASEIAHLSRRIYELLTDPDAAPIQPGQLLSSSLPQGHGSHTGSASGASGQRNEDASESESDRESNNSHDELLRRSVREALGSGQH
ncbi:vacuolar protein 8 [Auriculariales sp. MPI-PUGE-AT-0066]|nr:vacuolar protein 8 [Auriculariales sp. MPI-PUGE-AT-0066]